MDYYERLIGQLSYIKLSEATKNINDK